MAQIRHRLSGIKKALISKCLFLMVPGAGIEPARPQSRGILSPLCLPISPPGQQAAHYKQDFTIVHTQFAYFLVEGGNW